MIEDLLMCLQDLVKVIELVNENSSFDAEVINIANGEEVLIEDAVSIFFSYFKDIFSG